MKRSILAVVVIISSVFINSCKKAEDNPVLPPAEPPQLSLSLSDRSCTEAWIRLNTSNLTYPGNIEVQQNGSLRYRFSLTSSDTLLYIDSLLPNKDYYFIAEISQETESVTADTIQVTTLDTTSQNFTWLNRTFGGEAGSCTLYDVAIIDENDIWAVGEIYLLDTLGQTDPKPYNLARWNGFYWSLDQIPFEYNGNEYYGPIYSIFDFGGNDIWLGIGSMIHWDGNEFTSIKVPDNVFPSKANKLWGTSGSDLYVVGENGNIAHYNGQNWTKVESGTDLNINDIWGYTDNSENKMILCAAANLGTIGPNKLLRINDNSIDTLNWTPDKTIYTVWFHSIYKIYAGGNGLYTNYGEVWKLQTSVPHYFTTRIRGNGLNDVYSTGGYGYFAHFNGYSWADIPELRLSGGDYLGLAAKNNIICTVGYIGNKAVVAIVSK